MRYFEVFNPGNGKVLGRFGYEADAIFYVFVLDALGIMADWAEMCACLALDGSLRTCQVNPAIPG